MSYDKLELQTLSSSTCWCYYIFFTTFHHRKKKTCGISHCRKQKIKSVKNFREEAGFISLSSNMIVLSKLVSIEFTGPFDPSEFVRQRSFVTTLIPKANCNYRSQFPSAGGFLTRNKPSGLLDLFVFFSFFLYLSHLF